MVFNDQQRGNRLVVEDYNMVTELDDLRVDGVCVLFTACSNDLH